MGQMVSTHLPGVSVRERLHCCLRIRMTAMTTWKGSTQWSWTTCETGKPSFTTNTPS